MIYLILAENQVHKYIQTAQKQQPQSIKSSQSQSDNINQHILQISLIKTIIN